MEVCRAGKVLMMAERRGSLYYLTALICSKGCAELHSIASCTLSQWHTRLGHPSAGSVREHWSALKWLMKYLKGASNIGILFDGTRECSGNALMGWTDSDYAGNVDTRRSQSGYIFTLYGSVVSWKSSLQTVVALSTTEAEFMALAAAVKESFWLKGILNDFGVTQETVEIGCDNTSAISLAKHQVYHERSKHIDVRLHFIREKIEEGEVKVFKVDTSENPADMLTKPLPKSKLELCMKLVNLCKMDH